jgi:membrane protein
MPAAAAPPPIVGTSIDPPPREVPRYAERLDRTAAGGIAYRTMARYAYAHVGLLVSGTAYYLFLSLLSLLAVAYGVFAIVGADQLAKLLTDALGDALPGLVGTESIDPDQLRSTGTTAGMVGLVFLLYSGLGAIGGASSSMHLIFGAAPDPRNFVKAKARHLLVLIAIAPLVVVSFGSASLASSLIGPVLEAIGWDPAPDRTALIGLGLAVGFVVDLSILWILLGRLGGIRPHRPPRLIASLVGAVAVGAIKQLLEEIVAWSLDKPQYGAFAAPLAILFILALLTTVLYASAALAGGISDRQVPLAELQPTPDDVPTNGKRPVRDSSND